LEWCVLLALDHSSSMACCKKIVFIWRRSCHRRCSWASGTSVGSGCGVMYVWCSRNRPRALQSHVDPDAVWPVSLPAVFTFRRRIVAAISGSNVVCYGLHNL
jgi:hypothetical protein